MRSFKDKVVAITGAGSGIGRALAGAFAAQGSRLALSDRDPAGLQATVDGLAGTAGGQPIHQTTVDVADRDAIYAWAAAVEAQFGTVHIIINNAGVALGATVEGASDADLHWLMDINFWGVVHGTRAFLPALRRAGEGHVVNISSLFGLISVPTQSAYCASKAAVRGFTESLRMELELEACGVSATVVHPGGIRTEIARRARSANAGVAAVMGSDDMERNQRDFDKRLVMPPPKAAHIILAAVRRDARRVLVGMDAVAVASLQRLAPAGYQSAVIKQVRADKARLAAKAGRAAKP